MTYEFEEEDESLIRNDEWIEENIARATDWLHRNKRFFGNEDEDHQDRAVVFFKINELDIMISIKYPNWMKRNNTGYPVPLNKKPTRFQFELEFVVNEHFRLKRLANEKNKKENHDLHI